MIRPEENMRLWICWTYNKRHGVWACDVTTDQDDYNDFKNQAKQLGCVFKSSCRKIQAPRNPND